MKHKNRIYPDDWPARCGESPTPSSPATASSSAMSAQSIQDQLAAIHLFEHADEALLKELSREVNPIQLQANQILLSQGDPVTGMYAVLSGRLKIYMLSCSGKERVVRLIGEGDSFAEVMVINEIPSPVFVQSLTPCELLVLPKPYIDRLLSQRLDISQAMVRGLSHIALELLTDLQACCLQNAVQRIAQYLCTLSSFSADEQRFVLPAPKATIASLLNLTPESFSRGLNQLASAGLLSIDKKEITVYDLVMLKSVSSGAINPATK